MPVKVSQSIVIPLICVNLTPPRGLNVKTCDVNQAESYVQPGQKDAKLQHATF